MNRLKYIDIAKGITIIMVIIGHSTSGVLRGTIFSFHMPLFFIISSFTYSYSKDIKTFWNKCKNNARHLLVPMVVLFLFKSSLELIQSSVRGEHINWYQELLSLLMTFYYSSGVPITNDNLNIGSIGMLWFIVALFLGRTLFELCKFCFRNNNILVLVCLVLSSIGYFLGKMSWLPLCFDVVLFIQPFFLIGDLLKDFNFKIYIYKSMYINSFLWGVH